MSHIKLRPTDDHLVVQPKEAEEMTKSGLYIPPSASKERPQEGTVMAVGPGKMSEEGKRMSMDIKVGDKVLFSKYGPTEVKMDNKELLILSQGDVLAIIES
ncbi:MAG: co-chaperone GroES [Patescibacteria group bacterium]